MDRCAICRTRIGPEDARTSCPHCLQDYHAACWDELGGCATYGCSAAAVAEATVPPPRTSGWGDEKECPACRATIPSSLLVCTRCKARFPWADPITPLDYRGWIERNQQLRSSSRTLLLCFVFSLLGFTAPLLGLVAGIYSYVNRKLLAGSHGTYLALGYGTAALGVIYSLIFILLFLGR